MLKRNLIRMKKPKLSEIHKQLDADMGTYAGWEMPIKYDGILPEHLAVRRNVGLFDISHMGEIKVSGSGAFELLQYVTSNDISELEKGSEHYSLILNEEGGVKDDLFVCQISEREYILVINAANTNKIYSWLVDHNEEVLIEDITSKTTMLALQGPESEKVLQKLTKFDLGEIDRFRLKWIEVSGIQVLVSRSGYTGEDGFEIYLFGQKQENFDDSVGVWNKLMKEGKEAGIKPCGLGARDSLRLEAGFPLYGHELTEEITPLEAGIDFAVELDKGNFIGRGALLTQREEGISKKRIGIKMKEKGIPRGGYDLFRKSEKVGEVTSGGYSPLLETGIGMGYASPELKVGDVINVEIRRQKRKGLVKEWPFYEEVHDE